MSLSRTFFLLSLFLLVLLGLFSSPLVRADASEDSLADGESVSESGEVDELAVSEDGESDSEPVEIEEILDDAGSLIGELEPHPDVQMSVFFPEAADKKFAQDHDITALVAVQNVGPEAFNISYSGAHLHSAIDYSYYVQNLSVYHVDMILQPGGQATVEYRFRAHPDLEPVDFLFSGWLIYNTTNGKIFKSNFANTTIWLVEPEFKWDFQSISTYFIVLAFFGGLGYLAYNSLLGGKKRSNKRSKSSGSSSGEKEVRPPPVWETANVYTPKPQGGSKKKPSKKE